MTGPSPVPATPEHEPQPRVPERNGAAARRRFRAAAPDATPAEPPDLVASPTRRRWPLVVLVGVLAAAAGIGAGLLLAPRAGGQQVVVLRRAVAAGIALAPGDLATTRVSGAAVPGDAVPASQAGSVVGQVARTVLADRSVLVRSALRSGAARGSLLGLALPPGRVPDGVVVGSPVRLILIPAPPTAQNVAPAPATVLVRRSTVAGVRLVPGSDPRTVVSVLVEDRDSLAVAQASGRDEVGLIVLPR